MVARLVAEEGDLKGLVFDLEDREEWVIGRDPDESQIVVEDPLVSRRHLIAHKTPEGIVVENLSTTNPVQVNDETIDEPRLLRHGDTLRIGSEVFRFYADSVAHVLEDEIDHAPSPPAQESQPVDQSDPAEHNLVEENEERHDTIFPEEGEEDRASLAEIDFGIEELGRWLLKVISGPNNGAEFYMKPSHSYIIGTDPHTCDIVFHDTSVSRQHARINVSSEEALTIEDLKSRNGVLIGGQPLEGKQELTPSLIVTLGTTSFVVYDREGEMQTIISPLLPSIVKVLQQDEVKRESEENSALSSRAEDALPLKPDPEPVIVNEPPKPSLSRFIFPAILGSILVLGGLGTASLFRSSPVASVSQENTQELIQKALEPFPTVKFSFNKSTGGLLLIGHVLTAADKNQLLYNLQELNNFVKFTDDSGLIIDEYAWTEINSILSKNPTWAGVTVHSPTAGHFILSGYLKTRKQAEQLSDFMSVNFSYLDLLEKRVIVEEDVVNQVNLLLQEKGLRAITAQLTNGELVLSGGASEDKVNDLAQVIEQAKDIPGVRTVRSLVRASAADMGVIDLTDRYDITGQSRLGDKYTVVINGHILSEGDVLDGLLITSIKPNVVLLEKGSNKYRIDYNR